MFCLLLEYDGVSVAHGEVEADKLLCLFYRVNLDVVGTLPFASFLLVRAGALYADQCCSVSCLWFSCGGRFGCCLPGGVLWRGFQIF